MSCPHNTIERESPGVDLWFCTECHREFKLAPLIVQVNQVGERNTAIPRSEGER